MSGQVQTWWSKIGIIVFCGCSLSTAAQTQPAQRSQIPAAEVAQIIAQVRSTKSTDASIAEAVSVGQALSREGRFNEAAQVFGAVLERTPRDARALYGAALAAFNLGQTADAQSLVRTAVEVLLPEFPVVPANLSPERRSDTANALVLYAVVTAVRGNQTASLKFAEQAAKIAPASFDAQFTFGRALFEASDYSGAAVAFRQANSLNPNDVRALFFLGTSLERANDLEGALRSYRELIAKQPQAPEGHLGCGILLVRRGGEQALEGIRELERALEINPDIYEGRIELGKGLITKGRSAEALPHLQRASELAPGNPEPHYQLALAYRRLGRREDAAREDAIVKTIHEQRRSVKSPREATMP